MPDVTVWLNAEDFEFGSGEHPARELDKNLDFGYMLKKLIAEQLSCLVDTVHYDMQPGEVDLVFPEGWVQSDTTAVIIQIAAYAYPDRMLDINERLQRIAAEVKNYLFLGESKQVSVTFVPVPPDCWTSA